MKKFLCAVTVFVLLLTGCSKTAGGNELRLPDEISAEVSITHNSSQYSATLTQGQGYINLSYSAPKYLNGLSLTKDENGSTAELSGLRVSSAANYFSDNSAICVLQKILTAAKKSSAELSSERSGETMIFSGETDGMKYRIKTDLQAQSIYEISVPDKAFTFTFN